MWVAAAVALKWPSHGQFCDLFQAFKAEYFRPALREIKGSTFAADLKPGIEEVNGLGAIRRLIDSVDASVWVSACAYTETRHDRYPEAGTNPKLIARHLLVDRVNGMARSQQFGQRSWLFACDISSSGDLAKFSMTVNGFRDVISGRGRSAAINPEVVGVTSERWPAIQVADVFAYYARHAIASRLGVKGAKLPKGLAFCKTLRPALKKSWDNRVVGLAYWPKQIPAAAYVSPWGSRIPSYLELVTLNRM